MKNKTNILITIFLLVLIAHATLFAAPTLIPLEVGNWWEYSRTDASGNAWTVDWKVLAEVTYASNNYFQIRETNYEPGTIDDFYIRSTEDTLYGWNGTTEEIDLQAAPVGTTWIRGNDLVEIIAIEPVTVPYGGPYEAYVHRKHDFVLNSPYYYEYIVPGLGLVKEVDYWNDDPPMTMELIAAGGSTAIIPAPGSLLLTTIGLTFLTHLRKNRIS